MCMHMYTYLLDEIYYQEVHACYAKLNLYTVLINITLPLKCVLHVFGSSLSTSRTKTAMTRHHTLIPQKLRIIGYLTESVLVSGKS